MDSTDPNCNRRKTRGHSFQFSLTQFAGVRVFMRSNVSPVANILLSPFGVMPVTGMPGREYRFYQSLESPLIGNGHPGPCANHWLYLDAIV